MLQTKRHPLMWEKAFPITPDERQRKCNSFSRLYVGENTIVSVNTYSVNTYIPANMER